MIGNNLGRMAATSALAFSGSLAGAEPITPAIPSDGNPPNIVILLADDMAWFDVKAFGGEHTPARTPHLDRLAKQGMAFNNFYSSAATCAPMRMALLTGLYPIRNGAHPNHGVIRPGTRTLSHHFEGLGYETCHAGKHHLSPAERFRFNVRLEYQENPQVPGRDRKSVV